MPSKGTTNQRGYGMAHRKLRERMAKQVRAGGVICWRCGQLIPADADFDLGHDDLDRSRYMGPEHVACNRATKGRPTKPPPIGPPADTTRNW